MTKIQRVLFLCYANVCRSPAAEALAEYYANHYKLNGVTFDSAGWHAAFSTAVQETKDYLGKKDIDMTHFKSKTITRDLVEDADLIIGMELSHLAKLRRKFKDLKEELENKLFTLKQFNGTPKGEHNIPDPYQTGSKNYNRIMKIVEENVEKLVKKIKMINNF